MLEVNGDADIARAYPMDPFRASKFRCRAQSIGELLGDKAILRRAVIHGISGGA